MAKIVRSNLTDQIFDYLRDEINEGKWKIGEKIPSEIELAESLGVSRVSLRNAIQKANFMGLLETRVGEGTFVCRFNMQNYIKDLYTSKLLNLNPNEINDLRFIFQKGSAELAMENPNLDTEIQDLEIILNRMEVSIKNNDLDTFYKDDIKFHRKICLMSGNELLYMLYDAVESLINDLIKENTKHSINMAKNTHYILEHHQKLLASIKNRDMDAFNVALNESRRRSLSYYSK